jgi:dipeptidyl aminopeptidase/acylaminoacyl peptidase
VKKQLAFLVLGLAVVLVAAGQLARAAAGPSHQDIQDILPAWSSNGVDIAFERTAPGIRHVLDMSAGGRSAHVANAAGTFRGWVPGSEHLLVETGAGRTLLQDDSADDRPLAELAGTDASASPDGTRVAYLRDGTLYVAAIEGTGERAVASGVAPPSSDVAGPAWSPDGTRIVVASGSSLLLVRADGSGSRVLTTAGGNPSWSSDGSTIAFERSGHVWLIGADGSGEHDLASGRLPQFSPVEPATIAYVGGRRRVPGGATRYEYALYVQSIPGVAHKLLDDVHPSSRPAWSPTGLQIAVAAGQECRRWGIYVVRADTASRVARLSNRCRFDGGAGADRISGSQYFDIINGNGGNDTIRGNGGNDKISGENGNDTILGGAGNDFILAGPGDDVVYGGSGNDTIIGGNGHDRIDCGPGIDTVEGAGPLDRIAKSCEHVRR